MAGKERAAAVKRLISGIKPSGPLHLGHYVGALRQWLRYQDEYECYFMVADVQALATHRERPVVISESVREVVLDWLAVGLDPHKNRFLLQSRVPELAELTIYLQFLVRTGELSRNPTVREEARELGKGNLLEAVDEVDFGFLGYPVSQVADILLFSRSPPRADDHLIVPVGEDQLPHVAFACEVARRFNSAYRPVFVEPEARTAAVPRLPGTDGGSKMGKSRRNAILLKERVEDYAPKIRAMFTDPLRIRPEEPGHPDSCPCFLFREAFGRDETERSRRWQDCLLGKTDCDDCRVELVSEVESFLAPIQERRADYERDPDLIGDVLREGSRRAREVAQHTIAAVRDAMSLTYPGLLNEARKP